MNPTPYGYPPWEPDDLTTYKPGYVPGVVCDQKVRYFVGLAPVSYPGDPEITPDRRWYPTELGTGSQRCNLRTLIRGQTSDFVFTGVPKAVWTKTVITVNLNSEPVAGSFNPADQFFGNTPVDGEPWAIGFTNGSTESWSYKQSVVENAGRTFPWRECRKATRNYPLFWRGVDDLQALTEMKVTSSITPNVTYQFTLDMKDNGIVIENGDRIRWFAGANLGPTVRSVYCAYHFARHLEVSDVPYYMSGSRVVP